MLVGVCGVVVASCIAGIGAPLLFSHLIDRLAGQAAAGSLVWGFVGYAVLLGLASALQRMVQYLSFMTAENLGFIASTRYFGRILRKSAAFFVEHNPSEIQAAGEKGRNALTILVQLGLIAFMPGALQISLALVTLGSLIDMDVVAIVLAYGALTIGLTTVATRRARVYLDAAVAASQENARFAGNAMNAMETLRHFGSHRWMSTRFTERAAQVRDNWRSFVLRRIGYTVVSGIGLGVQFAVTFLLLVPRYEAGALTLGNLVLFNLLLLQLNAPFEMIARGVDDVARARATLVPLARLWAAPEEAGIADAPRFVPVRGRLVFEAVSYTYDNGRGVRDVSFEAARGAITFLTGETGAGKSTVFRLALKSIEPDSGRILVDGVDLADIARDDWHAVVAVVPQDVVLLNESLADNILLGRQGDEARLRRAAAKAAILPFIEALPDGFATTVGERGLKLSGGERQRIAIARALYGDPAILFLDEASAALDEATEREIMAHIRAIAQDVTILAITHRKAVIASGDRTVAPGRPL